MIDTRTGNKVGEYKTKRFAEMAIKLFRQHNVIGLNSIPVPNQVVEAVDNAIEAAQKRMQQPNGDPQPELPRHSNKRRVELD